MIVSAEAKGITLSSIPVDESVDDVSDLLNLVSSKAT
jgi:hypothetical protein